MVGTVAAVTVAGRPPPTYVSGVARLVLVTHGSDGTGSGGVARAFGRESL